MQITRDYQRITREGWHEQFRMMSQKRKQVGSLAQIQEIGIVGEPFNYRLHDIIKTEETDQETQSVVTSKESYKL